MTASKIQPQTDLEQTYRRNFPFFLADNLLFMMAISILGPTTLIPDFIRHLTSSEILIGVSSSLFDVGWALPQLFIARYIVRFERKKWWFVGPNIPVRFVILSFAVITVMLGKDKLSEILIAFLIAYGVAAVGDGLVGVPWAVLAGTSLDNRWRARMFGWATAVAGLIMLGISPLIGIALGSAGPAFPNNYALIFGAAGVLFAISILPVIFVHELPGGKATETIPSIRVFLPGLGKVLRGDSQFRAMIVTRMLTSLFAMAGPFYIGFATVQLGLSSSVAVPVLLAMQTIGSVSGALIYSWIGARSNLMYIRLALGLAGLLPVSALLAVVLGPWPLYIGFLISGLTAMNLFMSFQNWVITYATPEQRPIYAGLFNTAAAFISLVAPLIGGTIAQEIGYEALFVTALAMGLAALFVAIRHIHADVTP